MFNVMFLNKIVILLYLDLKPLFSSCVYVYVCVPVTATVLHLIYLTQGSSLDLDVVSSAGLASDLLQGSPGLVFRVLGSQEGCHAHLA